MSLSIERLKELLDYDRTTGEFRWRKKRSRTAVPGALAGNADKNGYIRIGIDGKIYFAHRLAWFYVTGQWPSMDIDHRDRVSGNNIFDNLRLATKAQNYLNRPVRKYAGKTSKFKGVSMRISRYTPKTVTYEVSLGSTYLGSFRTETEAATVYDRAAIAKYGEYALTNGAQGLLTISHESILNTSDPIGDED